jgi:hypothetical protein
MLIRLVGCIGFLAATAFAGWPRYVSGDGKGGFTDSPPAHSLAYFQVDPCLRPESDALVGAMECTWRGAPPPTPDERKRRAEARTKLVEVGKIGGFTIYDLWYSRGNGTYPPDPSLRSVLVKVAADRYREMDVQIRWGAIFPASQIGKLDGEPILIANYHDGGNHSSVHQRLYMFRAGGWETPDFKAVDEAVAKLKPDMSVLDSTNDYTSLTYVWQVYKTPGLPRGPINEHGQITVTYRFVDGHAVVTSSKYEPYSQ